MFHIHTPRGQRVLRHRSYHLLVLRLPGTNANDAFNSLASHDAVRRRLYASRLISHSYNASFIHR